MAKTLSTDGYTLEQAQHSVRSNPWTLAPGGNWPVRCNPMDFQEWREGTEKKLSFKDMQVILSSMIWTGPR
ncbi:MAG: hypothetical protein WC761_00020 [Candidatus Paceibacterota bacterium]|jgi:hypothetical protein